MPIMLFPHDARGYFARLYGHRLINDALLYLVIAHFYMAGQGHVLAERIADKAIVGKDAAQIGMAGKDDAIQVKRFALIPVGARPNVGHRIQHRQCILFGKNTHAQTPVMGQ